MFLNFKRPTADDERSLAASRHVLDALMARVPEGVFMLDSKGCVVAPVSRSLNALFARGDFDHASFDRLLAPLVSAKTLAAVRAYLPQLLGDTPRPAADEKNPLALVDVRMPAVSGPATARQYSFAFDPVETQGESRLWLVRLTDVTARVAADRQLEDLRTQLKAQSEILSGVLELGGARFVAFLRETATSMRLINAVLRRHAGEPAALRRMLDETLGRISRLRRAAAAFKLSGLAAAARSFERSLRELRGRDACNAEDFLPLAVQLDQLRAQFATIKAVTLRAVPDRHANPAADPRIAAALPAVGADAGMANAIALERALAALTGHTAQEQGKAIALECTGLEQVPAGYQGTVKNVAMQLLCNAVAHGIETPAARIAMGKPPQGILRLEFKSIPDGGFELVVEDDGGGLDPDRVRATAIARGIVTEAVAARMRDREAIKLIFRSGYAMLAAQADAGLHHDTTPLNGLAMIRRHINEAGGRISLASLPGHETRFKVVLPPLARPDAQVA